MVGGGRGDHFPVVQHHLDLHQSVGKMAMDVYSYLNDGMDRVLGACKDWKRM